MQCRKCSRKAGVETDNPYCKSHFLELFESKVANAIRQFQLLDRKDRISVAASGGKDSTSLLYILQKLGYDVEALAIDEGIQGYREGTLAGLREFCTSHGIKLKIASYQEQFGFTLDELMSRSNYKIPCMPCGILRRYLLNKAARGYDKLATGHNLDDEAQSVMMNMMKSNIHLMARLGPSTGVLTDNRFTPRVKPLYFCTEKEVATYSFLQGFSIKYSECPNAPKSFRAMIRDFLNDAESKSPGTKASIVHSFLKLSPLLKQMPVESPLLHCAECGEPSSRETCNACNIARIVIFK